MNFYLVIPVFLGLTVVAQGVLNRRIGGEWGLSSAVFLNAVVFMIVSSALIFTAKLFPQLMPDYLKMRPIDLDKMKLWFVIPGLCGFFLVLGIPWSIQMAGPSKTFLVLIASQIVLGLLYEKLFLDEPISTMKYVGALVSTIGVALFTLG